MPGEEGETEKICGFARFGGRKEGQNLWICQIWGRGRKEGENLWICQIGGGGEICGFTATASFPLPLFLVAIPLKRRRI